MMRKSDQEEMEEVYMILMTTIAAAKDQVVLAMDTQQRTLVHHPHIQANQVQDMEVRLQRPKKVNRQIKAY